MGCSPSKGQLFVGVSAHKALKPESQVGNTDFLSDGTEIQDKTEISIVSAELTILEDENTPVPLQGDGPSPCDVECDTTVFREAVDVETNVDVQEGLLPQDKTNRKDGRKKKNRGAKRSKQKEKIRKPVHIRSKVELPEKLVKANQAAYAYLDPNVLKYESLLGLLDQATKTQLSLQPMVALLASRYEEINQALEEMAVEGEQMLEENGAHMAWPAAFKEALFNTSKPDAEVYSSEPSKDLLQQMIHHSTEKLRLIGDSVRGLGDAALEEAVVYFASISQLLGEKLEVKRAAEGRLKQVLDRVEVAVLKKSSLEDSALHSEDSGIGADNECQNGSVRLRRHRESSGSGSSTGSSTSFPENTLSAQPHLNGVEEDRNDDDDDGEEEEEEGEDEDEEDSSEDEEGAKDEHRRKFSVTVKMTDCAQTDPCKYPLQVSLQSGKQVSKRVKWTDQMDRNRPQTAGNLSAQSRENPRHSRLRGPRRSQSADCLYFKVDDETKKWQEKNLKDNQKPDSKGKGLAGSVAFGGLGRTRVRRNSLEGHNTERCYGLQYGSKGPFKATIPPSLPPAFVPVPPGRNAVKRLINTFSQGAQDRSNQKPTNVPTKVRGTKKAFLPMLSNNKGGVSTNGNNNNNSYSVEQRFSERPEDVDVDSLPPPPPEVLMDNSFESNEGPPGEEDGTETQNQGCVVQRQRGSVSQRLRASLHSVTVLPSRASVPRRTQSISPARPVRQDAMTGSHQDQDCGQTMGVSAEKEEAASLYQQSRKIIHLRHSSDSAAKTGPGDQGIIRAGSVVKQGSRESGENESLAPYPNSYPPTTPPVSRARLPPSCPTARHRIPSPPALPTSPACEQLGASVRPSSPSLQRWSRRSSDEENGIGSFSFCDARSVFCQEAQSASQSLTPSCRSTLPRPWGEPPRGRLQTVLPPQAFMKSSPSGVRHTFVDQQQPLPSAMQPHSQDSERRAPSPAGEVTQELPDPRSAQGVTGAQEAESSRIMDNKD